MTDKVTIDRETLQSALDAVDPHFRWHTAIVNLRAALAAQPADCDDCAEHASLKDSYGQLLAENVRLRQPAEPVEPVAWRFNTLEGVGLPANWHYLDIEPCGSAFTVQPLYVAPPSPADLIPQDKLFVCGQMGAHVTRVRVEQPAAVPLTDETRKTLDSLIEHVWAFYDIMEDGPDESDEAMATDHFVKAINIIRNHRAMIAAAGEPSHD